jgi:hypothetical protein
MVTAVSRLQLKMEFEPGITDQFKTLKQCVAAVVYGSRIGLNGCAAACDVSPSTLTKMLNKQDDAENQRHLPLDFLPLIVEATGDLRPLQWLGAKFLPNDEMRRDAAIARMEQLLPELASLLAASKGGAR